MIQVYAHTERVTGSILRAEHVADIETDDEPEDPQEFADRYDGDSIIFRPSETAIVSNTLVIGLGHYSRTGKDTFANYLIALLGKHAPQVRVLKRSLAWKLKQVTHELYAWAGIQPPEHYETREGEKDRDIVLPALSMTPVEVWVAFGTKAVRNNVYDRTWLDYLLKSDHQLRRADCPRRAVPQRGRRHQGDAGGVSIKIVRPGYGPRKTVADRALLGYDGWDYVLGDGGTMESLNLAARPFAAWAAGEADRPIQTPAERADGLTVEKIEPWGPPAD